MLGEQLIPGFVGQAEFCTLFCEQRGSKRVGPGGRPSQGMKWQELWPRVCSGSRRPFQGHVTETHRASVGEC